MQEQSTSARILVVDDEPANVLLLRRMLERAGYRAIETITDPREVLPAYLRQQPDIVLLDLLMPYLNGFAVMEQLATHTPDGVFVPVVVLTADITPEARQRALAAGAMDFLTKPFDQTELLLRVRNLLRTRELHVQVTRQNAVLERLYEEAHQALQLRDATLSSVGHDLGQPIASIRVASRLLGRKVAGDTLNAAETAMELAEIDAALAAMWSMVVELLDLARLEAGRPLELHEQELDLVALARAQAETWRKLAERHHFRVVAEQSALIGEWDPDRLARVIANLLSNAVKYSREGSEITIAVDQEQAGPARWAVLRVRDQGEGIPAADLPHVFERFHRGANAATLAQGAGIGLAGVRQIVEQHGGTVGIESIEGQGTTVTVRLPLYDPLDD